MRHKQRLHREQDPRVRRSLVTGLACALLLIVSGLAVVGLRVQQVHLGYQLDGLRADRGRAEALIRQLEVEVATLRSPARVEMRARQLGLTAPHREQVRMAREFLPGGSGESSATGRRVAAGVPTRSFVMESLLP